MSDDVPTFSVQREVSRMTQAERWCVYAEYNGVTWRNAEAVSTIEEADYLFTIISSLFSGALYGSAWSPLDDWRAQV